MEKKLTTAGIAIFLVVLLANAQETNDPINQSTAPTGPINETVHLNEKTINQTVDLGGVNNTLTDHEINTFTTEQELSMDYATQSNDSRPILNHLSENSTAILPIEDQEAIGSSIESSTNQVTTVQQTAVAGKMGESAIRVSFGIYLQVAE